VSGVATLEGRTDHSGTLVKLSGTPRVGVTDAEGRWAFAGVPEGLWSIEFAADGYFPWSQDDVEVHPREETVVGPLGLLATARRVAIFGKVLLAGAGDHAGTRITLDGSTAVALTRADGTFVLGGLAAGTHRVVARRDGYVPLEADVSVDGRSDVTLDPWTMQPVPAPGAIVGRVTAAGTSTPIVGATVMVSGGGSTKTADDGTYALSVPDGAWELRAGKSGYAPVVIPGVVVFSEQVTELDLRLVPGEGASAIVGSAFRLGDPDHAGIQVVLTDGDLSFEAATLPDGRWEIIEIPEGLYDLAVTSVGLGTEIHRGVAVEAGLNRAPTVHLSRAIRIADRNSWDAWVLPRSGLALVQFGGRIIAPAFVATAATDAPEIYVGVFDPRTREVRVLAEGMVDVMAIDPDERFATVMRDGGFFRLSLADGALEEVDVGSGVHLLSDRGLSFFREDESVLVVRAADLSGRSLTVPCSPLWMWTQGNEQNEDYAVVSTSNDCGWFEAPANVRVGFVGPFSQNRFTNDDSSRWISIVDGPLGDMAMLTDLAAARTSDLPGPIVSYFPSGSGLGYVTSGTGESLDLHVIDLGTGASSTIRGLSAYVPVGANALSWMGTSSVGWAYLDGRGTGTLCDSYQSIDSDGETLLACVDSVGVLRVWMEGEGAATIWDSGVAGVVGTGQGFVIWEKDDGTHLVRHASGAQRTLPACAWFDTAPSWDPDRVVVYCGSLMSAGTSFAYEASSGTFFPLAPAVPWAPPSRCEFSPAFDAAVCETYYETTEISVQSLGG
ncbi:MAG TPA: carboxypeptidase-like regulatory domain-containing protein, partial [Vulgatibacter sp.]